MDSSSSRKRRTLNPRRRRELKRHQVQASSPTEDQNTPPPAPKWWQWSNIRGRYINIHGEQTDETMDDTTIVDDTTEEGIDMTAGVALSGVKPTAVVTKDEEEVCVATNEKEAGVNREEPRLLWSDVIDET